MGTIVDAKMKALCQQYNANVQAYKARIDHLESMLASLKIHEPLELLPTTSGVSTSQSVQNYQYTVNMFMKNQCLYQNLKNANRANAGL